MKSSNQAKKSLGQNFLIDKNIIKKIVSIGKINKNKIILEIGPGLGALTNEIINKKPKKIIAIEKDKKLSLSLESKFSEHQFVKIINNDIMKIFNKINIGKNIIIFGNLPYNISTQILASFMLISKWPVWYEELIFMFQKEVAERIIATENTKNYGRLSVLCNWRMNIVKHFDISKNCFKPKPKISSTVLSFKPKNEYKYNLKNPKNLETVTRILFSNRRKIIKKNFLKLFKNNLPLANELNLDLKKRPGELSKETFYKIAAKYEELFC